MIKGARQAELHVGLDTCAYRDMSPLVIPAGYTRSFLEGKIDRASQEDKIKTAYRNISEQHDFTVVEGTGHTGVGSVVGVSNAKVASLLGLEMVLVVNGGLGKAYDELALNRLMCLEHGVKVRGVIVNRVRQDKYEMVQKYFKMALESWGWDLIGCVPDGQFIDNPTMRDFEGLFKTQLLSGQEHHLEHFNNVEVVSTGLRRFVEKLDNQDNDWNKTLFLTHVSREDIILGFLSHSAVYQQEHGTFFPGGLLLTGSPGPSNTLSQHIYKAITSNHDAMVMHVQLPTHEVSKRITQFTAKLNATDVERTAMTCQQYEPYINFDKIIG